MNAKSRDVLTGWQIFRNSHFSISREEINRQLLANKLNPVSERTYTHYRKLARFGYRRYIPINQLDVETQRERVFETPLRSRIRSRSSNLAVQLTITKNNELITIDGEASSISESELSVKFQDVAVWGMASSLQGLEESYCLVTFPASQETKPAIIDLVEIDDERREISIAISFRNLVDIRPLETRTAITSTEATITVVSRGGPYLAETLGTLTAVFRSLDSARLVCDAALVQMDPEQRMVLPLPEIRRLQIGSPFTIALSIAVPIVSLVTAVSLIYVRVWTGHQKGEIDRQKARALRIGNDRAEVRSIVERAELVAHVQGRLLASMPDRERKAASLRHVDPTRLKELLDHQLLPDMDGIFDENLQNFVVETPELHPPADPPNNPNRA